jgi:hypothetical protein
MSADGGGSIPTQLLLIPILTDSGRFTGEIDLTQK